MSQVLLQCKSPRLRITGENRSIIHDMKITKITVLTGSGGDNLMMETDLPNGMWPYTGVSSIRLDVAAEMGESFVQTHFPGIPYEVIVTTGFVR